MHIKGIIYIGLLSLLLTCTFMAVLFVISHYVFASPRISAYANCQKMFPERVFVMEYPFRDQALNLK